MQNKRFPTFLLPRVRKQKEKGGSSPIPSRVKKTRPCQQYPPREKGGATLPASSSFPFCFLSLPSFHNEVGAKEGIKENKNVWRRPRIGDAAIASKTGIQRLTLASSASLPFLPPHLFNLLSPSSPGWSHSLPFPFSLLDRMRVCVCMCTYVWCVYSPMKATTILERCSRVLFVVQR